MPLPPQPAASAAPASWLIDRIGITNDHWVTDTAGIGFPAYARIFHPLGDEQGARRWRDIAVENGRVLHPSAQWEHVARPPGQPGPDHHTGRSYPAEPDCGDLRPVFLEPLCDVLAAHTATSNRCWFAIWEGWGWWGGPPSMVVLHAVSSADGDAAPTDDAAAEDDATALDAAPDEWQLDRSAPRFEQPTRTYLLFQGAVHDALRFGYWVTPTWFDAQSPSLFWPDDHAWCVATEIDFDTTLVGGSAALVNAIVASPALEALQIAADAPWHDRVNV